MKYQYNAKYNKPVGYVMQCTLEKACAEKGGCTSLEKSHVEGEGIDVGQSRGDEHC